jgi:hypothetical protein
VSRGVAVFITDDVEFDPEHDERRVWQVFEGDDWGEPVGTIHQIDGGEEAAWRFARRMSSELRLPIEAG